MDYREIWYRFCSYVLKSKKESELLSTKEYLFRDSLVDYFNIELGWDKQCIETEYIVHSGCADKKCDIMIHDNFNKKEELFLIECKRPNNKQSLRNRKQLDSYIATTRICIGIYIGEYIEIFYDERTDKALALPVFRVDYNPTNNPNGEKFIELFHKKSFNKEKLISFCRERYQPILYLNKELAYSDNYIKKLILQDLKYKYGNSKSPLIEEILTRFSFSISDKNDLHSNIDTKDENDKTYANSSIITDHDIKPDLHTYHLLSEDTIRTLKRDIKNIHIMLEHQLESDKKIHIITPFSDAYFEKRKKFKIETGIDQKDMALYAFYKYIHPENAIDIQTNHSKYKDLVKGEKKNTVNVEIPASLWKNAMELFGVRITKKQIAAEAICYFLDKVIK